MPEFVRRIRRTATIDAIQIQEGAMYTMTERGSWLVVDEDGYQYILSNEQFRKKFDPI